MVRGILVAVLITGKAPPYQELKVFWYSAESTESTESTLRAWFRVWYLMLFFTKNWRYSGMAIESGRGWYRLVLEAPTYQELKVFWYFAESGRGWFRVWYLMLLLTKNWSYSGTVFESGRWWYRVWYLTLLLTKNWRYPGMAIESGRESGSVSGT